jgi:hypothetical protein
MGSKKTEEWKSTWSHWTGVTPEAFKAMNNANLLYIHQHVNDFFVGITDMNNGIKVSVYQSQKTGDLSDPNKWRGIMLMDVGSKIFSSVMNKPAFKLLNALGNRFQFGGTFELGC